MEEKNKYKQQSPGLAFRCSPHLVTYPENQHGLPKGFDLGDREGMTGHGQVKGPYGILGQGVPSTLQDYEMITAAEPETSRNDE